MEFNKLMKIGMWLMIGCTILGFTPLVVAVTAGIFGGREVMDEIAASDIWLGLMQVALPLAFVLGIVGFTLFIVGLFQTWPRKK